MKASELRIGNCVFEGERLVLIHDGFGIDHAHNFKPIPLAEEWIQKLGGVKDEEGVFYCIQLEKELRLYLTEAGTIVLCRGANCPIHVFDHVNSVHLFQNLYHALTGNELTINPTHTNK
jgi:hypothetical protein